MAIAESVFEWTVGDRLRKARKDAGLEQADLAVKVGVSRPTVSKWERNLGEPGASQLLKWAQTCGVTVSNLVGEESTSARLSHDPRQGTLALAWSQDETDHRFSPSKSPPLLHVVPSSDHPE